MSDIKALSFVCCLVIFTLAVLLPIPIYSIVVGSQHADDTCWDSYEHAPNLLPPGTWLLAGGVINLILVCANTILVYVTYLSGHASTGAKHPNLPIPTMLLAALFNFIWIVIGGVASTDVCYNNSTSLYTCVAVTIASDTLICAASLGVIVVTCLHCCLV